MAGPVSTYGLLSFEGMGSINDRLNVRQIAAGTADFHLALHSALNAAPSTAGADPAPQVASLLINVRRGMASIDLLFGAYLADELVTACLAVESPGATALVFVSNDLRPAIRYRAAVMTIQALQPAARQRSLALLEALVAPPLHQLGRVFREAGFRYLTRLLYLKRAGSHCTPLPRTSSDLEWVQYTPDCEALFERAIERTYVQSQDCTELTGLRRVADVLVGHRATAIFNPGLWWVAMRGGESVGVILLNRMPSDPALEVVYMGVAQPARGQGVADAMLARAVSEANRISANTLTLAVDQRNTPARRLYARWGFVETGVRDAWIASPCRI